MPKNLKAKLPPKHKWRKISLITGGVIAGLVGLNFFLNIVVFQPVANPVYGASFSVKQARLYGTDWKQNYLALLDDLKFKHLRLMSYWNEIEPERGQFNFADLDWQMNEAAKRGVKVGLSIGLRQPRWPECHPPTWADNLAGDEWKQALFAYMELVIKRYKDSPALDSYQLENEFLNNWFGICDPADRQRVVEEFNLVKQWDPNHPIQMTLSDEHGLPIGQPEPDAYGFTMYRIVYNTNFGPAGYALYPTSVWWHRLRAAVITWLHPNKPISVHELQMEPWGPGENWYLSTEEQNKSMSVEQIHKMTDFARRSGFTRADFWGSEWWYWRKVNGDPSVWEAVRNELKQQQDY